MNQDTISTEVLNDIHLLAEMIQKSKNPVLLTGAGISVASGISTFRGDDEDAAWKHTEKKQRVFEYTEEPTEIGTNRYFTNDPVKSWYWYYTRFSSVFDKLPNPAHYAVRDLQKYCSEQGKNVQLITQNIDGLHRKAGSEDHIEIHGRADRIRCTQIGCANGAPNGSVPLNIDDFQAFVQSPSLEHIPKCSICNHLLRPHVLWFDEYYTDHVDFQFYRAEDIFAQGDLLIFIGTTLSVGITYSATRTFEDNNHPIWLIDPKPIDEGVYTLAGKSEIVLPKLVEVLRT